MPVLSGAKALEIPPYSRQNVVVPWITIGLLLAAASVHQTKPACNKFNHGRFWPDAANWNAGVRRAAERDGSLEFCSYGVWRYRWIPMTVSVRQLDNARRDPFPADAEAGAKSTR